MFNLIKAIFRSGKKSIMLVVFFILLIFGASLSFGALYGTANSMKTSYTAVLKQNKLHNFTINENYKLDEIVYKIAKNPQHQNDNYIESRVRILRDDNQFVNVFTNQKHNPLKIKRWINNKLTSKPSTLKFIFPNKFKTLKTKYELADLPTLLTPNLVKKAQNLHVLLSLKQVTSQNLEKNFTSNLQLFRLAKARNFTKQGEADVETYEAGQKSFAKFAMLIKSQQPIVPNQYFYVYSYQDGNNELQNLFIDIKDIIANLNAILKKFKTKFKRLIASKLLPDLAVTRNLMQVQNYQADDLNARLKFIEESFKLWTNRHFTPTKQIINNYLTQSELDQTMTLQNFFIEESELTRMNSDQFMTWKKYEVPIANAKWQKMLAAKIARLQKINGQEVRQIKIYQEFDGSANEEYYKLHTKMVSNLVNLKRHRLFSMIKAQTNIDLSNNIKSSASASSYSSYNTYKMINYNPKTNTDLLTSFNQQNERAFENLTKFETQAIKLIKAGRDQQQFDKAFFPISKGPDLNTLVGVILQEITKNTIVKLKTKENNYSLSYAYNQKISGAIASLPLGTKIKTDVETSVQNRFKFEFLKSFVAVGNKQAMDAQSKKSINPKKLIKLYEWWRNKKVAGKLINARSPIDDFINSDLIGSEHVINARGINYILIGAGNTPEFSYPIIDAAHPIPDFERQMLLYISTSGMDRFMDTFTVLDTTQYVAGRYTGETTLDNVAQREVIKKIVNETMEYSDRNDAFKVNDDVSDQTFIVAKRISHINQIISKTNVISIVTMIIIGGFSAIIALAIIAKFLQDRAKSFGILKANGMTSLKIILAVIFYVALVTLVISLLGFIVGSFLQRPMFMMIGDFWTLPTKIVRFDAVGFLIVLSVMVLGITLLATLMTMKRINVPALKLISATKVDSQNKIMRKIKRTFSYANVKVKYGIALSMTSIGKLLGFMMAIIASMVIVIFSLTSLNIFKTAQQETVSKHNYKYKIELVSPTRAGGLYALDTWNNITNKMTFRGEKALKQGLFQNANYQVATKGTNRSTHPDWNIFEEYHGGIGDSVKRDGFFIPLLQALPDFKGLKQPFPFNQRNETKTVLHQNIEKMVDYYLESWWKAQQHAAGSIMSAQWKNQHIQQVRQIIAQPDFQKFQSYVSSNQYDVTKPNQFNVFLPSFADETDLRSNINFLRNKYITREFLNGQIGGVGQLEISIAIAKNLWSWATSTIPNATAVNAAILGEKFALDAFNTNLATLKSEYDASLQRKVFAKNGHDFKTVATLLGHKVLVEHAFLKWKAFRDEDSQVALETGKPAVKFDRVAAYNQVPEHHYLWSGGMENSYERNYNPYFAFPINMVPNVKFQTLMRQDQHSLLSYNIALQNIYQHHALPWEPYTRTVNLGLTIKETFFDFIRSATKANGQHQFRMFYGGIPIDQEEASYTYLRSKLTHVKNVRDFSSKIANFKKETIKINGISQTANSLINLENKDQEKIYQTLQNFQSPTSAKQKVYPIIVNEVVANSLDVKKGDQLTFDVYNHVDKLANPQPHKVNFQVVSILATYRGSEFYTTQKIANHLLGLDQMNGIEARKFNGIISNNSHSKLLFNSITTYSKSGLYPAINKVLDAKTAAIDDEFRSFFFVFDFANNYPLIKEMNQNFDAITKSLNISGVAISALPSRQKVIPFPNLKDPYWQYVKQKQAHADVALALENKYGPIYETMLDAQNTIALAIVKVYGSQFINSAIDNAEFYQVASKIFGSYANTANSFETIIIILALIIVVIVILTITTILITSNRRSFATLKILGYKRSDTSKIFLTIYLPFLIVGIIIGIILAFLTVYLFIEITLKSTQILLPLQISAWSIIASISIIVLVFTIAFGFSLHKIDKLDALKALK